MRIVVTGQTGVGHKTVLQKLIAFTLKQTGYPEEYVKAYFIEDEIRNLGIEHDSYLDSYDDADQEEVWENAFRNLLLKIEDERPKYIFLDFHLSFLRHSRFFSPISTEAIKQFSPDVFITLIDDIQSIWTRINLEDAIRPSGSYFRLREIISWRSEEIAATDNLCKNIYPQKSIKNYIVPVKHPPQMLYRLLFVPETQILYSACPITGTREDSQKRGEVDNYRMRLHEEFTVFDPLTIDEEILILAYKKQFGKSPKDTGFRPSENDFVILHEEDRWPISLDWSLHGDTEKDNTKKLPAIEVQEVAEDIGNHIRSRDFRLIRQSQFFMSYRPNYQGTLSKGQFAELQYARDTAKIPRFVVHLSEDGDPEEHPFSDLGIVCNSLDKAIEALRKRRKHVSRQ